MDKKQYIKIVIVSGLVGALLTILGYQAYIVYRLNKQVIANSQNVQAIINFLTQAQQAPQRAQQESQPASTPSP